ncbi:uncharacterized protein EAF02_003607 [Botrytis sinoallii]|uniref:uncharacterized protein n=1 Tax=Botrytis sinoallii TaxID=1463999 RepID=UPI00190005D7|nr:uncharacterized protein EAF02_003607 [Botrytis sinoallii]KAF7886960.1 hypothetical protein EAF02_003607 [Botrytis sinoallii]
MVVLYINNTATPNSDPEIVKFETERHAWVTINMVFNQRADFPGVRPYVVTPTAIQNPEQKSKWKPVSTQDIVTWKSMGNRAMFQGKETLDLPWAKLLKTSLHGWKMEDGIPIPFFGRLIHHRRAFLLTTGTNFRTMTSFQKRVGSRINVTVERPDRRDGENASMVCIYLNIRNPSDYRKDNVLMDVAYILNFLSRYKIVVSQSKFGQFGCPDLVKMWDSFVSSEYPHSVAFKLPAPIVSRSKQEEDDAEYHRLAGEEDRKIKEAEEKAKAEQLAAEVKKTFEETEKRQRAEEEEAAEEKRLEHPLIKNPLEKPDWLHQKTLSWMVVNYSEELSGDELLMVLRRDFGICPKV